MRKWAIVLVPVVTVLAVAYMLPAAPATAEAAPSTSSIAAQDATYVGGRDGCRKCHLREFRSWQRTPHAKAFDILKDEGEDGNPDCVKCHVTGFGDASGFTSEADTPQLSNVTCEVCHGPGGTYTKTEHMSLKNKSYKKAEVVAVGMVDTVAVEQCKGCHNTESPFVGDDYVFDFEVNKDKGTHRKFPLKYEH